MHLWTFERVADFFQEIGLEACCNIVRYKKIDGAELCEKWEQEQESVKAGEGGWL
jgi:hypothetical protein